MSLWICKDCTAAYAVGLPACPQCGSTTHTTKDDLERAMPKISRSGGPSYETAPADAQPTETAAAPETEPEAPPAPAKSAKADPAAPADEPASPPPAPGK